MANARAENFKAEISILLEKCSFHSPSAASASASASSASGCVRKKGERERERKKKETQKTSIIGILKTSIYFAGK